MKLVIKCTDIAWDVDDGEMSKKEQKATLAKLPDNVTLEIDTDDLDLDEIISDRLSDLYGFFHDGFCWDIKRIKRETKEV